eukprot:COSAG02_NODE_57267_length_281_cov_0.835165_1_plen_84_part_10
MLSRPARLQTRERRAALGNRPPCYQAHARTVAVEFVGHSPSCRQSLRRLYFHQAHQDRWLGTVWPVALLSQAAPTAGTTLIELV